MEKVSSRPRLIFFAVFCLTIGPLGYFAIASTVMQLQDRNFFSENDEKPIAANWTAIIFFIVVVCYALWRHIWNCQFISIDSAEKILRVRFPFRFMQRRFSFTDVNGFSIAANNSNWCDEKLLVFHLNTGNKFKVSDMETANLRQVESIAWNVFPFIDEKTGQVLTQEGKEVRKTVNWEFDFRQEKSIRFSLSISLLALLFIAFLDLFYSSARQLPVSFRIVLFSLLTCLCFEWLTIVRTVKKLKAISPLNIESES